MAGAQLDAAEPPCGEGQSLEQPARRAGEGPAPIGQAAPASFQETQLIVEANDPPRTGAERVKSRQPPRAPHGCEDPIAFVRIENEFRSASGSNFFAQQQAQ